MKWSSGDLALINILLGHSYSYHLLGLTGTEQHGTTDSHQKCMCVYIFIHSC